MNKHTPGPWVFNKTIPRIVSSNQGYITRDICRMDASTMSAFDQDANAQLIAAAPELLSMVVEMLDALGHGDSELENDARELIAKATGGEALAEQRKSK